MVEISAFLSERDLYRLSTSVNREWLVYGHLLDGLGIGDFVIKQSSTIQIAVLLLAQHFWERVAYQIFSLQPYNISP